MNYVEILLSSVGLSWEKEQQWTLYAYAICKCQA